MIRRSLIGISLALTLGGCGEQEATHAIESYGFTSVRLTGIPIFGCGEHDSVFYNTKFEAVGVNGKPIHGVACGGILKSWTVRVD